MSTQIAAVGRPPAVLYDIDWQTYTRLLPLFERSGRRFRLTYDRGTLEITSPLWEHENPAYLLGRYVDVLTEEFNLMQVAGRSLTLRRRKKQRGLEPDNCYWIASAPLLQGKTKIDLRVDPPPDLGIEVDVTSRSLDRLSIYAALKVPEVWRLCSTGLAFHILDGTKYQIRTHSLAFPKLTSVDLAEFLTQIGATDNNARVRQFRTWVQQNLLQ